MKAIYKYEIPIQDTPSLRMPKGARILHAHAQNNIPYVWALVDVTDTVPEKRTFLMYGTGHEITHDEKHGIYIGTFHLHNGSIVFHLFERRIQ